MCKLLVEADQVVDVYIAVVFLYKSIFAKLFTRSLLAHDLSCCDKVIPIDEFAVQTEVKSEGFELCLDLQSRVARFRGARLVYMRRIYRWRIHYGRLSGFAER